jgi:integrase
LKIVTTTFFDEIRSRWRVRFRGAALDTRLNVPDEAFEGEGVSPQSTSLRAENVALDWASKKRAELLLPRTTGPMTLRQVYELMKTTNPDAVTEATWIRNDIHIRNLERLPLASPLGSVSPDQIDGHLAALYRNARQSEEAASRTVEGELIFLIRLLRFGFEEASRATGMSAIRLTKSPKIVIEEQQMVALTIDQFFAVLDAIKSMRQGREVTRRRLIFGVTTMLRKTPLMGLRAEWIDLSDPWLEVPASAQKGRRGEKRPLSVPLSGWATEQLPNPLPVTGLVWANSRTGGPTGNLTHTLNRLADAAKVARFSLHDLRATGNTWLANAGVDERVRQYLMGHRDGGKVIARYTRVTVDTEKQIRDAVQIFDDIRATRENVTSIHVRRRSA